MRVATKRERRAVPALAGAASVEAVIALPVLLLLAFGIAFVQRIHAARESAVRSARRCAFAYAVAGCERVPESCGSTPQTEQTRAGRASSERIVSAVRARGQSSFDVFDDVPVIGTAIRELFGSSAHVTRDFSVRAVAGKAHVNGTVELTLACNERPHSVLADVEQVFCRHLPVLDCKGSSR